MERTLFQRPSDATNVFDRNSGQIPAMGVNIRYHGSVYDCWASETVLDAFVRHGVEIDYSCRKGLCLGCMVRATTGAVPEAAQSGIEGRLRAPRATFCPACAGRWRT
jgi:ferredoxin